MQHSVDDWLGLATVIGDPHCRLVVVMRKEEYKSPHFTTTGDCHQDHEHVAAVGEAIKILLTKNRR